MTIYKDIYPETILNIINNENFNNIELDSPMIKPEVIAKALNITFDEKLTVDFDSASRSIKPSLYDDFLANRRKNMWRIANVIVGTDLPPSRLVEELQERASARLTDELLMPEKLLKRLIKEQMAPAQLFKSENPLWAHGQTIYRIQEVQELYERIKYDKQKKYEFYKLFDDLLNNKTHYWTACHIEEL